MFMDINVFAKFYEILSLPFQETEKPKCCRRMDGLMDGQPENSISQDNVIGNVTFPICHNDSYEEFHQIKYSNFAKYLAFVFFQQKI